MSYKLSPSSLSLLKECSRCFWLHHNMGIKRPSGIFPSLPSGMDRILKEHFDSFMRKGMLPPELDSLNDVALFDNTDLLAEWRNNLRGIQWTDEKGNLFRGAVDNILVHNTDSAEKMIVLDYKTRGYPLKEDTHEHYQDQMDIYNFLLRKNNYDTENYAYLIFYHPSEVQHNGDVVFNTDLIKIKVSVKNAENIFEKALKVLEGNITESSNECDYCCWVEECK